VLVGATFVVTFDGTTNLVVSVAAYAVVTTLSQSTTACASGSSPVLVSVPLTTSVAWVDQATTAAAPQVGRSGAPGYLTSYPVLAGVLVTMSGGTVASAATTDKTAVVRGAPASTRVAALAPLDVGAGFEVAGLMLRGPGPTGACVSSTSLTAALLAVNFGEDMSSSCHLQLDAVALATLCAASSGASSSGVGTFSYMGLWSVNTTTSGTLLPATYVGIFGNADPWKAWQWTAIQSNALTASASWDATRMVCSGVPAAMNFEFLTATVGEVGNPQRKIIAVRSSFKTDTWAFGREDVRTNADSSGNFAQQKFLLKTTVTFSEYPASSASTYVAPVPPVITSVPADLWYPFSTSS